MKIKNIIISLLLFFLVVPFINVNALSVAHTSVGYGYEYYDTNNTYHKVNWVSYSTDNLVKYNYDLPSTYNNEDIDILDFGFRFHIDGNFKANTNYALTFTWSNYDSYDNVFLMFFSHLLQTYHCRVSSWTSTSQDESYCFNSSEITYSKGSRDSDVIITWYFTPKIEFYGGVIYNYHDNDPYISFPSDGWEITNISYTTTTDSSQDIINNQNQNTQNIINNQNNNTSSIINNQNQNTQNIINNQNANTQAQINSQKVCKKYDSSNISSNNLLLNSNGVEISNNNYGITPYISISSGDTITPLNRFYGTGAHYCFYNINKTVISCSTLGSMQNDVSLTIPSGASFFRSTIYKPSNLPLLEVCKNGNQAVTDTLTDDNVSGANSDASNFFSGFTTETYGLTGVITAPLNVIQSITSKTCTPLALPLPFVNQNLTLPCMGEIYTQYFGSFLTIYQTITFGIVAYWVVVRIFNLVKDFKNPDHDEIEVLDL